MTLNVVPGGGTTPFSFQWYRGASGDTSAPIAGATSRTYTTPALTADTSYWVRVSNAAGSADSTTARVSIKGPFQVDLDGFSFANNYRYQPGTDPYALASWTQFKRAFPATTMDTSSGQPRFGPLSYFLSDAYQQIGAGDCAGMTAVSLIRYLDLAETVERDQLNPINRSRTQVADFPGIPTGDAHTGLSDVKDYIFLYQARQMSREFASWWQAHHSDTPSQTYQAIKTSTQAGTPVAVDIFPATGNFGHRMVAYRTQESANTGYIYIYDSNWPGYTNLRITVDLAANAWTYDLGNGLVSGYLWSNTGTGMYYSPASQNFPAHLPAQFDVNTTTTTTAIGDDLMINLAGSVQPLISDSQGRQIGYRNGVLVEEIPGAVRLTAPGFNLAAPNAPQPETFLLPVGDVYTTTVQPVSATSVYTLTAFGGGSALTLAGTSVTTGTSDMLVLRNSVLDTTFRPAADGAYCEALTREVSGVNSREYTACISNGTGVPARFSLDPVTNAFDMQNNGTQPVNATLTTNQVGSFTGQDTKTGSVAPGATLTAPPPKARVYLPAVQR